MISDRELSWMTASHNSFMGYCLSHFHKNSFGIIIPICPPSFIRLYALRKMEAVYDSNFSRNAIFFSLLYASGI